jgi:hypothetical protein
MASANDNSGIPSLSTPVPGHRRNGQWYRDGLPQLFVSQNWPLAAAATGKHMQGMSYALCLHIVNE